MSGVRVNTANYVSNITEHLYRRMERKAGSSRLDKVVANGVADEIANGMQVQLARKALEG